MAYFVPKSFENAFGFILFLNPLRALLACILFLDPLIRRNFYVPDSMFPEGWVGDLRRPETRPPPPIGSYSSV